MDNSYEKLSPDMYISRTVPFILQSANLCVTSNPWLHWHESIELLRCDRGSGDFFMDGYCYAFDEGDIIAVNSGVPHFIRNTAKNALYYRYIIIDPSFFKENGIELSKILFSPHIHDITAIKLFDRAFDAGNSEGAFFDLSARTAAQNLILYLCENHLCHADDSHGAQSITEIKKTVNYIRGNFASELTLEKVAGIAGFSVCYFSRKFKKITGQTFITFLNTVRCENAAKMLKNGAKVSEACYKCGFSEPSYFSRTFKTIMGYAPSEAAKHK